MIEKAIAGDNRALNEIWQSWSPRIRIYLRHRGLSPEDQEDLLQEIMSKIFKALPRYSHLYSVSTWIYTIAGNSVVDWRRKSSRRFRTYWEGNPEAYEIDMISEIPDPAPGPEATLLRKSEIQKVQDFIERQTRENRQILFLVCFEGLSGRAAAGIMEIPVETLRDRLKKLKKELKVYLSDAEI